MHPPPQKKTIIMKHHYWILVLALALLRPVQLSLVPSPVDIEIDIDTIANDTRAVLITVGKQLYGCTIKSPPVLHSWSYECERMVD